MNFDFFRAIAWDINPRFEVWEDFVNKSTHFRNSRGEELVITREDMILLSEHEIMQKLINHIAGEVTEQASRYIGDGTTAAQRRIIEINNELDIIRGVVPTPKGYIINVKKAKDLMEELKALMKEVNDGPTI